MEKSTTLAVTAATVYGLLLRILHDLLDQFLGSIISISFVMLAPLTIGFLTIYLLPKDQTKSMVSIIFKPFLPCAILMCITIALNIEGTICWLMIFPLFAFTASLGGIIASQIRKKNDRDSNQKNRNTLYGSFILCLPLVLGFIEGDTTSSRKDFYISRSVIIKASSKQVWKELTNINEIKPEEQKNSLSTFLGFPRHISTTIEKLEIGGRRIAIYDKGLFFNETIAKLENEQLLVLNININPNTIPVKVMDEHIVLGGKHVDILQDVYRLQSLSDGTCKLTLSSHFYINTPFNWYAGLWSEYLMGDILKSQINLIQSRTYKI
ncbi:hypothetical protein [Leptospira brenneri]|uniref:SRPBCC family protein n=1 Tax=Leptospira brenneri TaxID=2023182 RepID=A0A2M9Y5E5_9LEPT|nr:hypothetical protein [Leptospira brenneri]PJZ46800.1 hypothetical protein CH361_00075 [Leptospira brenneri]TGK96245.1 hypothetical protein EHQ30_06445 [Leptospira brenneri]